MKESYTVYLPLNIIYYSYANNKYYCQILDGRTHFFTYPESDRIRALLTEETTLLKELESDSGKKLGCGESIGLFVVLYVIFWVVSLLFGAKDAEWPIPVSLIIVILGLISDKIQNGHKNELYEQKKKEANETILYIRKQKKEKGEKFLRGF